MADNPLTLEKMLRGAQNLDVWETATSGDEDTDWTNLVGDKGPSLKKAIKTIMQKAPINSTPFATKAALIADTTLADGAFAFVYNDTDDNNGLYKKVGGIWQYQTWNPNATINRKIGTGTFYLAFDGKLLVDFEKLTVKVTHAGNLVFGSSYISVPVSEEIPFASSEYPSGAHKVCINRNNGAPKLFTTLEKVTEDYIILGNIYERVWQPLNDNILCYVKYGTTANYYGAGGLRADLNFATMVAGLITIDYANNQLTLSGAYIIAGSTAWQINKTISLDKDYTYVFIDRYSGEILLTDKIDFLTDYFYLIYVNNNGTITTLINTAFFKVISTVGKSAVIHGLNSTTNYENAFLSDNCMLTVNYQNKTVSVNNGDNYLFYDTKFISLSNAFNNTFDLANPETWVRIIAFDLDTQKFVVIDTTQKFNKKLVILGYLFLGKLYCSDANKNKITIINSSGSVVDTNPTTDNLFNPLNQRALLPNKLFFIENSGLPIYKDSLFSNPKDGLSALRTWLYTGNQDPIKQYQAITEQTIVNANDLSNAISIEYAHEAVADKRYHKTLVVKKAPQSKLARNFNMLNIGDSLTQVEIPHSIKTRLEQLGATVTSVGTYTSNESPNALPAEGRGWWSYRSFIGKDNVSGATHTRLADGATSGGKWENPFLKLATAADKVNYPNWCFRNTGSNKELSYADDSDKSGNFYIFDFAYYLSSHSVANPDFITIALSTNDINLDTDTYTFDEAMQYMLLGLEIMVTQIHKALPNVAIGIIPAPAWSATQQGYDTFATKTSKWIEKCIAKVESLRTTHSNIEIVPVYLHMNRDMGYPIVNDTNLSADSDVKVGTISDWVHFTQLGRNEYANAVAAWLANSI